MALANCTALLWYSGLILHHEKSHQNIWAAADKLTSGLYEETYRNNLWNRLTFQWTVRTFKPIDVPTCRVDWGHTSTWWDSGSTVRRGPAPHRCVDPVLYRALCRRQQQLTRPHRHTSFPIIAFTETQSDQMSSKLLSCFNILNFELKPT